MPLSQKRQADDEAIDALAKRLHWKMEHLDPTDDDDWEKMSDRQREFYRISVESLLEERAHLISALTLRWARRQRPNKSEN